MLADASATSPMLSQYSKVKQLATTAVLRCRYDLYHINALWAAKFACSSGQAKISAQKS
jgi:hypothetical protein